MSEQTCPHCFGEEAEGDPHFACRIADAAYHGDRVCPKCGTEWSGNLNRCPVCDDPESLGFLGWIRRRVVCLFSGHNLRWLRNIYGDEIHAVGGKRSLWECTRCGAYRYRDIPEMER